MPEPREAGLLDTFVVIDLGHFDAAVVAAGRQPRRRFADLLIASVAIAEDLPLYTRNPDDFSGLETLLDDVAL